ncbi:MAG TPA: histidine ammonia-lyase [Clostridiaceae bacterium]|nr:histidine ammonia-lyase [Clostridiaceae bacterium]
MNKLVLTGNDLTIENVVEAARKQLKVSLSTEARDKIIASNNLVKEIAASGQAVYGISTGFGELSKVYIDKDKNEVLQKNLILSHACAVGEPFPAEVVRAIMLLRLNTLCKGFSGVSPAVTDLLQEMLNRDVIPLIPEQGSLGASGDLANLAHMALVLIGEGQAWYQGQLLSGAKALAKSGLQPVNLSGKDGLAIINGTQIMAGLGTLALWQAKNICLAANLSAALSFEALRGITAAYDDRVHQLRPHQGQVAAAKFMLKALSGSEYINSRPGDVQDPYTLRCIPQVHGAVIDSVSHVEKVFEIEINSVTDNPIVFSDTGEVISGGNFHGEPLALSLDYLGIAVSELANISERRIERLVNPQLNFGLPAFLIEGGGVNSGLMIPQYVAASIVSENKVLSHPASVDSIPSSANKEDHVSMGAIAARKAVKIVENVRKVIAIEMMTAAQALDVQPVRKLGKATAVLYDRIRTVIPVLTHDRVLADDIVAVEKILMEQDFYTDMRKILL